ncbi:MAG: DUF1552 domain-containing protein [Myxococcales bacterium]|nr:DUF1552 domain-containing protein [Myxococcales bacterium]
MNHPLGRRELLRRLALHSVVGGSAALGLSSKARAADPPPKRLVIIHTPNGTLPESLFSGSGNAFTLGNILAPLAAHRSKILALRGLDFAAARGGYGGPHQKGMCALLTGKANLPGQFIGGGGNLRSGWASGISIDQVVANHIATRVDLPRKSLQLGVRIEGKDNRHRLSYRGANQPLPPIDNPHQVFDELFAGELATAEERARVRQDRSSVFDRVVDDIEWLRSRVGQEGAHHLEAHVESLREVERELLAPTMECNVARPNAFDHRAVDSFPRTMELQLKLALSALTCDLTRVVTLVTSGATAGMPYRFLGQNTGYHTLTHTAQTDNVKGQIRAINRWYATQFAAFVDGLAATPEPHHAGTMLDHTLVVWVSELGRGVDHNRSRVSAILIGNLGGHFRTGQGLSYGGSRDLNDVWTTVAQAAGLSMPRFGDPAIGRGALGDLT